MPADKSFVLNDEKQVNSYGFRILTAGIGLSRFRKNPVMLVDHRNSPDAVIGRWKNIRKEGPLLTAEPEFDSEDERAREIAGKIERGYLRSCSMGIMFNPDDFDVIDGVPVLKKSELMEVSIVAVPSNKNAVRLYSRADERWLTDAEVRELSLRLQPKIDDMKIELSQAVAQALGLDGNQTDMATLQAKILELSQAKEKAEKALLELQKKEEQRRLKAITEKVDKAIKEGKFKAEMRERLLKLGVSDEVLLDETLNAVPAPAQLNAMVKTPGGNLPKTMEEFQALSLEEQLAFKSNYPDKYIELVNKS